MMPTAWVVCASLAISAAGWYVCKPQSESIKQASSGATVSQTTYCLGAPLEGPIQVEADYKMLRQMFFRGPSPMHAVADPKQPNTIYFSWTEDLPWGKSSDDGRVHVTKLDLGTASNPTAKKLGQADFPGFMRASDIDITPEGKLGFLCAKHVPEWSRAWLGYTKDGSSERDDSAGLLLAVCHVDSGSMRPVGKPWRIGNAYGRQNGPKERHMGCYPKASWFEIRDNGYGWLTFDSHLRTWTTWYGATSGWHTGFAMHTYPDNASVAVGPWEFTQAGVEYRVEPSAPGAYGRKYRDHHRDGTGDHQMGSMTRYNPKLKDIAIVKHHHIPLYMQQYGLETPEGQFAPGPDGRSGHKPGRMELSCPAKGDVGRAEGAIRPCGTGWIMAIVTDKGNVCARIDRYGKFLQWEVVESNTWHDPDTLNLKQYYYNKMNRIATLGSPESEARCGTRGRFLMGYMTRGPERVPKRWLIEVDGNCKKLTEPLEVTTFTSWPKHQEWTTTQSGAVTWVTAWARDDDGKPIFNHYGTKPPLGIDRRMLYYNDTKDWPERWDSKTARRVPMGMREEAHVTVYWPRSAGTPAGSDDEAPDAKDVCDSKFPFPLPGIGDAKDSARSVAASAMLLAVAVVSAAF